MAQLTSRFRRGDVVKTHLDEPRGKQKTRWMVVLSDLQMEGNRSFYSCIAITTTFSEPPPAIVFELPWHPAGTASTGLLKRSAAVLDWVREMEPRNVLQKPNAVLAAIYRRLEEFQDEQDGGHAEA